MKVVLDTTQIKVSQTGEIVGATLVAISGGLQISCVIHKQSHCCSAT